MGPDTRRGWDPKKICADCGVEGCSWSSRNSRIVPGAGDTEGPFASFCIFCYSQRSKRNKQDVSPLPLGVKPPGVPLEFIEQEITVITQSGSEYNFGLPEQESPREVSCKTRDLGFSKCEILLLEKGQPIWLRGADVDPKDAYWQTSPVTSIIY